MLTWEQLAKKIANEKPAVKQDLLSDEELNSLRISCLKQQIRIESEDIGTMKRIAISSWASDSLKALANETIALALAYVGSLNDELNMTRKEIRLERYRSSKAV